jgi:hypothetical protein
MSEDFNSLFLSMVIRYLFSNLVSGKSGILFRFSALLGLNPLCCAGVEATGGAQRQLEAERARSEELRRQLQQQTKRLKAELNEQRRVASSRHDEAGGLDAAPFTHIYIYPCPSSISNLQRESFAYP